ncbi:hypothetical protein PIB30_092821 [Stylosanthes scabra]|uniref:Uncharacterized protein n=1 Tax=Stylosanthes scabra TaxID=79078 RepID=A0ABU6TUJ1_9FABA|nr:hypothetical protein [Stylosanthes scabra]
MIRLHPLAYSTDPSHFGQVSRKPWHPSHDFLMNQNPQKLLNPPTVFDQNMLQENPSTLPRILLIIRAQNPWYPIPFFTLFIVLVLEGESDSWREGREKRVMAQPTLEEIAAADRNIMYRLDSIAHVSRNVNREVH